MAQSMPVVGVTQQWWMKLEPRSPASKPGALITVPKVCSETEILQF